MFGKVWRMGGAVVMAIGMAACGSDPVDGGGDDLTVQQLYGTWEWVSSEGGIAGVRLTPESEGFEQRVVMRDPFQIELLVDGESVAVTTFTFSPADPDDNETLSRLNLADPLPGFGIRFVGIDLNGELVLADPCCDGFIYRFSRVGGS